MDKSKGFWVVDSVLAASGDPKKHAVAFCAGVMSANLLMDALNDQGEYDYIVVDENGQVV